MLPWRRRLRLQRGCGVPGGCGRLRCLYPWTASLPFRSCSARASRRFFYLEEEGPCNRYRPPSPIRESHRFPPAPAPHRPRARHLAALFGQGRNHEEAIQPHAAARQPDRGQVSGVVLGKQNPSTSVCTAPFSPSSGQWRGPWRERSSSSPSLKTLIIWTGGLLCYPLPLTRFGLSELPPPRPPECGVPSRSCCGCIGSKERCIRPRCHYPHR